MADPVIYTSKSGESKSISDWSKSTGIKLSTLRARIKKGMTIDEAIEASNPTLIKDPISGDEHTIEEWAQIVELPVSTIYNRLYVYHWPIDKALHEKKNTPVKRKPRAKDTYKHMDLTGIRFGNLTVERKDPEERIYTNNKGVELSEWKWICQCDCGKTVSIAQHKLLDGSSVTCGGHRLKDMTDLTGRRFGHLTVISRAPDMANNPTHDTYWHCACDCGNEADLIVPGMMLKNGKVTTCGCGLDLCEIPVFDPKIFGAYTGILVDYYGYDPEYGENNPDAWNDSKKDFVFSKWLNSNGFENFHNWSIENGYASGMQLYRRDPNGNYNPDNCYWAFPNDKPVVIGEDVIVSYNGVAMTIYQWAHQLYVNPSILYCRFLAGWNNNDILETPLDYTEKVFPSSIGEYHTVGEWSDLSGIDPLTLYNRVVKQNEPIDESLTLGATNPEIYNHIGTIGNERNDLSYITYGIKPIIGFGFNTYKSAFNVPGSDNLKQAIIYTDDFGNIIPQQEYEKRFGEDK